MLSEIKSIIEKVYIKGDHRFFISKCQQKIDFMDKLLETAQDQYKNVRLSNDSGDPSVEVYFELNGFSQGEFKVKYTSVLLISKIYEVFYLHHEFAVDNLDPSRMGLTLDSFSGQAYTRHQYDLEETITDFLQNQNYKKLNYAEMEEVIPEIDMPNNCIFGTQMTVENALFKDLWNICP